MINHKTLPDLIKELSNEINYEKIIKLTKEIIPELYYKIDSLESYGLQQQQVIANLNLRLETIEHKKN